MQSKIKIDGVAKLNYFLINLFLKIKNYKEGIKLIFNSIVAKDNLLLEIYGVMRSNVSNDVKVENVIKLLEENKEFNKVLKFEERERLNR